MHHLSLREVACAILLLQIALFLLPSATAVVRRRAPPTPVVRVATINLTHTTQIYTTGCYPGTANVTVGTQRITSVPFNLYFASTSSSHQAQKHDDNDEGSQLPAVYFLNGLNVPAFYYSDLATSLAASGFLVATNEYRRDTAFSVPGINATCKPYIFTSSATINTLMDGQAAETSATEGASALSLYRSHARQHGIILVGHSFGASAGLDIMFPGRCSRFAYNPFADLCEQYYPLTRGTDGADLIRGTFMWEGYSVVEPTEVPVVAALPMDKFAVYIQGEFNTLVRTAASSTLGSSCVHWIKMKGNHYGLANANPTGDSGASLDSDPVSQQPPCGRKGTNDPAGFTIPRSLQRQIIADLAAIITTMTRAILRLPGGGGSRKVVHLLASSTTVLDSALNASCFA